MNGVAFWQGYSHDSDSIIVEHRRDIFGRKLVCSVADKQTSLANSTVSDNDAPRKRIMLVKFQATFCSSCQLKDTIVAMAMSTPSHWRWKPHQVCGHDVDEILTGMLFEYRYV